MQSIKPMNIREAVEVMKILGPYAGEFTVFDDNIKIMKSMVKSIHEDAPINAGRLVALMEHRSVEEVAHDYENVQATASDLIVDIAKGFSRNGLRALIDAAFILGLAQSRWDDGR